MDIFEVMGKRLFDILFSAAVLVLGSPIFLLLALGVKSTSSGPIFYAAERIGKGGKIIHCWKFRTMCEDAEERLSELLQTSPSMRQEWKIYCKLKNDPRITPIGKWLRKTSLDELPQFWNVLRGDLSVVGPRPPIPDQIDEYYKDQAKEIFAVRPGITGPWQVAGRNFLSFADRVRLEAEYVKKRSFFSDLKIIAKTVYVLAFARGAF